MTEEVRITMEKMMAVAIGYVRHDYGDLTKDIFTIDKWESGHPFLWAVRPTGTWLFDMKKFDADFCDCVLNSQENRWFLGFVGSSFHELDLQKVKSFVDKYTDDACPHWLEG